MLAVHTDAYLLAGALRVRCRCSSRLHYDAVSTLLVRGACVCRCGRRRLAALEVPRPALLAHGKRRCSAGCLGVFAGRALRMELANLHLLFHNIVLRRAVLAPPPRATNRALRVRVAIANLGRTVTGRTLLVRRARAHTLHSCLVGWSG